MNQKANVRPVPDPPQSELSHMIEAGHKLVRLEGDQQRQIAKLDPRDEKRVLEALLQELSFAPEFAEKVYYTLPFKKKDNEGNETRELVQGISIKGAMAIQRRWGNCASAGRVVEEKINSITVEGVFLDYETNNRVMRQLEVSRFYKPRNSNTTVPLRPDMLEKAIHSGISKAIRNAVNNGVPEYIKIRFFEQAKEMAGMEYDPKAGKMVKKPLADRMAALVERFKVYGISKEDMLKLTDKFTMKDGNYQMTEKAYQDLLGMINALEDGHVTKDGLLDPEKPAGDGKKSDPAVKLETLVN